jgi:hypothetical protein
MTPIRFQKNYERRSVYVINKLKLIREAEVAYLNTYGTYTGSFDTLVNFIKHDSLTIIKSFGVVPDSIYLSSKTAKEAELRAIKLGIITRDTIRVGVQDSLFKNYNVDTLAFIPYSNLKVKFQLNAGTLKTLSKAVRPVFEVRAHNNIFTDGMDKQQVMNLNDQARKIGKYPGYIIGSLEEVTTNGNWD